MKPDYSLTNGRFTLPPSARGVIFVPVEHRGSAANVPVVVRSNGAKIRPIASFFRKRPLSAR